MTSKQYALALFDDIVAQTQWRSETFLLDNGATDAEIADVLQRLQADIAKERTKLTQFISDPTAPSHEAH